MSTKGKNWNWSEEAKAAHKDRERPWLQGNKNGVKHGLSQTLAYNSWKKMMRRCYDENDPFYYCYGEIGVTVCDRWHDVRNFYEDMGDRKKGWSIERIDPERGYEPENCFWVPMKYQAKNRRGWKHTEDGKRKIGEATRQRNLAKSQKET